MYSLDKKIAVLIESDFEDDELSELLQAVQSAGAEVLIIGSKARRKYRGEKHKVQFISDAAADEIDPHDFDAVIIPGGYAADKMRLHRSMIDMVSQIYRSGKLTAAIGHGPQLLISADTVRGKRMTSWPSIAVDLVNAGAVWLDEEVVKDSNVITSRKPDDLPAFNKAIIESLGGVYRHMIYTKRIYESTAQNKGRVFLVDRIWPRGISKSEIKIDGWLKDVAPSTNLRKWFHRERGRWQEFEKRYHDELEKEPEVWQPLLKAARAGDVTLLYSSKSSEHNNAAALKTYLDKKTREFSKA